MVKMKVEPNEMNVKVVGKLYEKLLGKIICHKSLPGNILFIGEPIAYVFTASKEPGKFELLNIACGASVVSDKYDDIDDDSIMAIIDWAVSKIK